MSVTLDTYPPVVRRSGQRISAPHPESAWQHRNCRMRCSPPMHQFRCRYVGGYGWVSLGGVPLLEGIAFAIPVGFIDGDGGSWLQAFQYQRRQPLFRLPDLIVADQVADIFARRAVAALLHLMVYKIFKGFREGDAHSCHVVTCKSSTAIDNGKICQNNPQKDRFLDTSGIQD